MKSKLLSPEQWAELIDKVMAGGSGEIIHAQLTDDGPEIVQDPDITSVQ